MPGFGPQSSHPHALPSPEELLRAMALSEKVSLLAGRDTWSTMPVDRLGIPSLSMMDGPHGVCARSTELERIPATCFPTGVALAAAWDPELIERVGAALGEEARALGYDVLLGPCVNIIRTPLAGRNFESYAEDPFLAGETGAAWVRGLQGRGVGASLKHFACNNQEFNRYAGSSVVDERALREIYLPAFETVVKRTRPWTVMCAYNRVNGSYASENRRLLTDILRGEWGFDSIVVSDWGAVHAIAEPLEAGLDIEMPGPARYRGRFMADAVRYGRIDEAEVDRAADRVLRLLIRSGKFGSGGRQDRKSVV
jgi:beta-glucosidase